MIINFKNRYIFFALATIWEGLHYKFKNHVNELVTANPDPEFVQQLEAPEAIIIQIYEANAKHAQGIAKYINVEMQAELVPQLMAEANLGAVSAGNPPNEAARILMACQAIDTLNAQYREAIVEQGKNLILS